MTCFYAPTHLFLNYKKGVDFYVLYHDMKQGKPTCSIQVG